MGQLSFRTRRPWAAWRLASASPKEARLRILELTVCQESIGGNGGEAEAGVPARCVECEGLGASRVALVPPHKLMFLGAFFCGFVRT